MAILANNEGLMHIQSLWRNIVKMVDNMVTEKSAKDVEGFNLDGADGEQKVKVIKPNSAEEVALLERQTIQMLEDSISMMYFGTDLASGEMQSDSSFLAKLSTRLHRKVQLSLEAPMAVGMYSGDNKVYLLINPIRLRFTVDTVGEIMAIIRHEMYHILYHHLSESKQYSNDKETMHILNIAQDCEINQSRLIADALPEGTITLDYVREKAKDSSLEANAGYVSYFKALMNSPEYRKEVKDMLGGETKVVTDEGNYGGDKDSDNGQGESSKVGLDDVVGAGSHSSWGDENVSQDTAEELVGNVIKDTYNSLSDKERGLLSSAIKGQVAKLDHEPDVNWRDIIRRQHGKMQSRNKRKTMSRPNRRMPERLDLRGELPDYDINIVMALDVSGSVSDNALEYAFGEGFHLSKEIGSPLTLLQIDSVLLSEEVIDKPSDFNLVSLNGRGGTRFQPAFDYLSENNLNSKNTLLVYVTDGFGESESELMRHGFDNVLWLLVDTNDKDVLSCDGKGRVELLNNDSKYANV